MKKIVFLAMFVGLSLVSVQCTKTVEERIVERERTNTILSGSTAPTATIGNVGDYYIDLTSVNLYGPKTAEGWGNPVNLRGLQGQNGTDGQNGQDAPIPHIGDDGYWYIGNTKTTVKAQGNNGADGQNGVTPTISEDGYWIVNGQKTNVKAKGEKGADGQNGTNGQNGITPTISIDNNGYWVINGVKTDIKAKGEKGEKGEDGQNGTTPSISIDNDGYWVINGVKTNTKAKGEKGQNGTTPTITIDNDGYWVINGIKSNTKAKGEKGEKGNDGQNGADAPKPNIKDGYWYIGNVNTNIKAQGERGLPGKDGSKIYAGQGNPPANAGREGDYYINTEDKIFYGPKTNTGWPSTGISLSAQQIITTDYELSPDGKTLLKWKNPNSRFIDMNADPKLKDVEFIAELAFNGEQVSYELRTFVIGNKVKSIGAKAFNGCFRLTTVEADENKTTQITEIKEQTFANCNHLQNIDIPSNVTTIGKRAFIGCYKLTTIILPEKVNKIEDQAFMQCKNLHTLITHNPTAFNINKKAFIQTHLRNIYVPSQKTDSYKALNADYKDIIK
ncbi:leucine-rich repeat protein [Capnocytophaga genosp. AHN8471]|uniref:leucine-rich repeat protein n=1 Tax=Capnocytophaga genosp. AHN8471 TaxID=327574 RepID=UPI0019336FFD|nr:leucine-rich repeat protein [Capnocytophaga genosp. AHN8471]MBM0655080.1 leucine-rich repeat protein [Capnocytophaga genosp. AHN8471]